MAKKNQVKKKTLSIRQTVLDGELSYLSQTAKRSALRRGDIPQEAVAAKS